MLNNLLTKFVIIATALSASSVAVAEIKKESSHGYSWLTSTSLSDVLKRAEVGEGYKIEGQKLKLEGWLASVESSKSNDGTPIYILQIAEALSIDLPGLRKNSANPKENLVFVCVTDDRSKVQKLEKDNLVQFNAEIREVKAGSYKRDFGATNSGARMVTNVKQSAVIAKCDFLAEQRNPAQEASAPIKAPNGDGTKAGRIAEPGANGSLTTASLCDTGEKVVFACNTGKKSVSVCSTQKGLQYRYGIDRKTLDISLDANGATAGQSPLAGGGVWYMRFSNGNTNYVVYSAESSSIDKAGLVVEQGGKRTATLTCKNAATVNENLAGEPKDKKGFDIP